jgi:Zn-dependent metalloprotease
MVFGDGDGELFNRFTIALDVIGHELAHGVTQDEAQLAYYGQSGALNESVSDVFGSLVKQHALKQTADQADWLIGAGLFTAKVNGEALRSMKAPGTAYDDPVLGKDPQPAHMRDFVRTYQDNGGVHINSGIPNHAFYLAAIKIGGYAWETAGRIWYETLRDSKLRPNSGFRTFARLTIANAGRLYGQNSREQQAIHASWTEVGVPIADLPIPTPASKAVGKAK